MLRDKNRKAARLATRNAQGKFAKAPTIDIFAFPPEIRTIIYTYHFAYERPNRTPGTIQEPTSSLKSKLALLRASKATRAEAKPIFYRNHIFHIPIPLTHVGRGVIGPRSVPLSLYYPNRLITSVQINEFPQNMVTWFHELRGEDHLHFQTFLKRLPNLKFLRLGFFSWNHTNSGMPDHPLLRLGSEICRILGELWLRLNRLEVYVLALTDSPDWQFRPAIAPVSEWVLEDSGAAEWWYGRQRLVWVLQRPRRASDVTGPTDG